MTKHLAPDYIYTPQGLQPNMLITISDEGRIASITSVGAQFIADITALPGVALLPGFVNVHSHVFQRALRGHTHRPLSQQDTFWTWRRAMYAEGTALLREAAALAARAPADGRVLFVNLPAWQAMGTMDTGEVVSE